MFHTRVTRPAFCRLGLIQAIGLSWSALLVSAVPSASADTHRDGWTPFVVPAIPVEDTQIDLSWMSPEPAGAHGFLRADGDDIVDDRGEPVRLFGTNITDFHAMPPKDRAEGIAKRLRQMGINFVRLHYFDWTTAPAGILADDREALNPVKLDELHFLVAKLKEHGIYTNINLHVSRGHTSLPQGWDWQGKAINRIVPEMIESQKRYARHLLTAKNPHTGLTLAEDPAVAVVEFNNENTLFHNGGGHAMMFASLEPRWREPIERMWNAFLQERYKSDAELSAAWELGQKAEEGDELLRNADLTAGTEGWSLEASGGAQATLEPFNTSDGKHGLRWLATLRGGASWNHQIHQNNVPVEGGEQYALRFKARRLGGNPVIEARLMYQDAAWDTLSGPSTVTPGGEWQSYEMQWLVSAASVTQPVRLSLSTNNLTGVLEIAELSLKRGASVTLEPGETLSAGTVPLPGRWMSRGSFKDWREFITQRELEYAKQMRAFVKDELGVKAMLLDSQANYGGTVGLVREIENADIIDMHGYPAHPQGGYVWQWPNESLLQGWRTDEFASLAMWRAAGKPMMVSEFDVNPANDHAAESFPLLATLACLQGFDALADYAWFNFQTGEADPYNAGRITSPFATVGHAGQMATVPTAALVYRLGLIDELRLERVLRVSRESLLSGEVSGSAIKAFYAKANIAENDAWTSKLGVSLVDDASAGEVGFMRDKNAEQQVRLIDTDGERRRLLVETLAYRSALGWFKPQETVALGDVSLTFHAKAMDGYANVTLVSLDGEPIDEAEVLLLTSLARVENAGMSFNEDRTSVGLQFGDGPTLAEPVPMDVSLPSSGSGWRAWHLDGDGRNVGEALSITSEGLLRIDADGFTPWVLIERGD